MYDSFGRDLGFPCKARARPPGPAEAEAQPGLEPRQGRRHAVLQGLGRLGEQGRLQQRLVAEAWAPPTEGKSGR